MTRTSAFDQSALREYYGKVLKGSSDLKTSACCCTEALPSSVKAALGEINDEVLSRFYGCGSPLPPLLDGCTILDLGCGSGRDAFLAARLAGPDGRIIGVDMTEEQLEVAERNLDSQMKRFGYTQPTVDFRLGFIEDLKTLGIEDNSIDVVISNCVINLSPDKETLFSEIFRVLKPGGELFFSDVFSDRRVPETLYSDPLLHGECLSGAMYREDFRRMLQKTGCLDSRVVTSRPISLDSPEVENLIGMINFSSITIRAFKLEMEDCSEDYGQTAEYKGTIPDSSQYFVLDDQHRFPAGKPMRVCGNTATMLESTRYAKHFTLCGDRSIHYGFFDNNEDESCACSGGACC